jgi:hypothetical protein
MRELPLGNATGSMNEQELFRRLSRVAAEGAWSPEQVAHVAMNLFCNAIRQGFSDRKGAEMEFDNLTGLLKTMLLDQYDSVTGKRRQVLPFDQTIEMPLLRVDDKF